MLLDDLVFIKEEPSLKNIFKNPIEETIEL